MTKIESKTVTVNKPAGELYNQLLDFQNFHQIMPDSVEQFEAKEESFKFKMKGLPEVGLKLEEKQEPNLIKLRSGGGKIDFTLDCNIVEAGENSSEVKYTFMGEFNMMMRMMVEKPLKNFIEKLADHTARL